MLFIKNNAITGTVSDFITRVILKMFTDSWTYYGCPIIGGHYIFALWFLSIFFLFFLAWFQPPQVGCLPYFDTLCGPSVKLECMSERCCTRLAANAGPKKVAKNRHLGTIPQICRAISSQLRHVSTIGKKLVEQQYLLYMSTQYGELRPTSGWGRFIRLGHPR